MSMPDDTLQMFSETDAPVDESVEERRNLLLYDSCLCGAAAMMKSEIKK